MESILGGSVGNLNPYLPVQAVSVALSLVREILTKWDIGGDKG